jgi:hypothetical protein
VQPIPVAAKPVDYSEECAKAMCKAVVEKGGVPDFEWALSHAIRENPLYERGQKQRAQERKERFTGALGSPGAMTPSGVGTMRRITDGFDVALVVRTKQLYDEWKAQREAA